MVSNTAFCVRLDLPKLSNYNSGTRGIKEEPEEEETAEEDDDLYGSVAKARRAALTRQSKQSVAEKGTVKNFYLV